MSNLNKYAKIGLDNIIQIKEIPGNEKLVEYLNTRKDIDEFINDENSIGSFDFNLLKLNYYFNKFMYLTNDYFNEEIDIIFNTNLTYYDLILNIIFLSLFFIVIIIIYWDSVYRDAKLNSRCYIMDNIINDNIFLKNSNIKPYIYNIYIIEDKEDKKLYSEDFLLKITYNFQNKTTTTETTTENPTTNQGSKKDFNYYDISDNKPKKISINDCDKKYIITNDKGDIIIKTDHANELKEFVKNYSNNPNTGLRPIYDIFHAYAKYKSSDY